jgi:hypothetical protein
MWQALLLAAVLGQAEGNPYVGQARQLYADLEFEKCVQRLEMAPQWKETTRAELKEIEIYSALCHYQLGNKRDAEDHFNLALQIDPEAQLPPYTSPKIVDLFKSLQKKVKPRTDKPNKTQLVPGDPPPGDGALLVPRPDDSELRRIAVPIGLGSLAVVACGTGAYFGVRAKELEQRGHDAYYASEGVALGGQAQDSATAANVAFGIALAAGAGAAVSYFFGPEPAEGARRAEVVQAPPPPPPPAAEPVKKPDSGKKAPLDEPLDF